MGGFPASPTTDRREVVMGYDEQEELTATGEWLLKINEVGFSEELHYVPSQLAKLGVAPVDVVDRLPWLKKQGRGTIQVQPERPVSKELVLVGRSAPVAVMDRIEAPVSVLDEFEVELEISVEVFAPLALDYDSCGPWEWSGKIESMIEDAIRSVLDPEPDLLVFNELSALTRKRKGRRRARAIAPVEPEPAMVGSQVSE